MIEFPDQERLAETLWRVARDRLVGAIVLATLACAGLAVLAVGWFSQPDPLTPGYAPLQPIPYSHRLHAGQLSVPCGYCHAGTTVSRHATVPPVELCMGCHKVTKTDSPTIQQLARIHESGEALEWRRVHRLPGHVYFDHRPHVGAGVACQTCHGPIQTLAVVSQHMSVRMGACLACHRAPEASLPRATAIVRGPQHCTACHR